MFEITGFKGTIEEFKELLIKEFEETPSLALKPVKLKEIPEARNIKEITEKIIKIDKQEDTIYLTTTFTPNIGIDIFFVYNLIFSGLENLQEKKIIKGFTANKESFKYL